MFILGLDMKNIRIYVLITFLISFFLTAGAIAGENKYKNFTDIGPLDKSELTIIEVVSDPRKFNREVITLDGKVTEIKYKKLINGKKFTLFKLKGDSNKTVKVYARGFIEELEDGSVIRINGRYSKEKKFVFKKYKNVMKARKIQILSS